MDNKKTENFIEGILNSQKPDKRVISAAKELMQKSHPRQTKSIWRICVSAACSLVFIIIGIIFVVPVPRSSFNNNAQTVTNSFNVPAASYGLYIGIALLVLGLVCGAAAIIFGVKNKRH